MPPQTIQIALGIAFLILSLGVHEAAHAYVADRCGDGTAREEGRLTLNPMAHIDPFMTIILPLILFMTSGFIFGGARPVPVNPMRLRHPLRDMSLVALAGPASNLVLALLFSVAWKAMIYWGGMPVSALAPRASSLSINVIAERVGSFTMDDRPALVLRVFQQYLELMRLLQSTYYLEPAGSHGVWGLDDYQHLCFFFGAAQLSQQREIAPSAVHDADLLEDGHKQWMYLAAVRFIRQVKKGPFREHSPYLSDISGVDGWLKIGVGLLRMYEVEVLGKFPVVQHLTFGRLLPWGDASSGDEGAGAAASGPAPSLGDTDAIRRGSYGTAPPKSRATTRLTTCSVTKKSKRAATTRASQR